MKKVLGMLLGAVALLTDVEATQKPFGADSIVKVFKKRLCQVVVSVRPLTGGLSGSQVFAVETRDCTYVLKHIPSNGFEKELARARFAARQGFGPHVYEYDSRQQWYLMDFLPGERILSDHRKDAYFYRALADLLKKIHTSSDAPMKPWSIYDSFDCVFASLRQKNAHRHEAMEIHKKIYQYITFAQQELSLDTTTPVFNDLNPGNLIYTKGIFYTIDPMDMSLGDPFIDLAYASLFWCFDTWSEQVLLQHYFSRTPTEQEYAKLTMMRKLVLLLMALHMESIAPKDVPFVYNLATTDTMSDLVQAYVNGTFVIKDAGDMMRVASLFVREALGTE